LGQKGGAAAADVRVIPAHPRKDPAVPILPSTT